MLYYCELSDGHTLPLETDCAATAVFRALRAHPGAKVLRCFSGFVGQDTSKWPLGGCDFDVPPHEPFTPGGTPPPTPKADQLLMFPLEPQPADAAQKQAK